MKQSKRSWQKRNSWSKPITTSPRIERDKRLATKKRKAANQSPKTIEIQATHDGFEAQIFFDLSDLNYSEHRRMSAVLIDGIKHLATGRYKFKKHKPYTYRKDRMLKSVLLENESDVFLIMMCHREYVKKIHTFKQNEAPDGASFLSSSGLNDRCSLPEMLASVA